MVTVRALSIHAGYICRHAGACCTAGWPIPVEAPLHRRVTDLLATGRLALPRPSQPPFDVHPDIRGEYAALLHHDARGACAFFEGDGSRLCSLHRHGGQDLLPAACRHFPRVALEDDRGAFVTLSHFCPTAAGELFRDDVPLEIVENPDFMVAEPEGLDARGALPPLLRPGILMDLDAYDAWERFTVRLFARNDLSPEAAIALVRKAAEKIRPWSPGNGNLLSRVERAGDEALTDVGGEDDGAGSADPWSGFARPIRNYLAARSFGTWIPYSGGLGLRTLVASLEASLALIRAEVTTLQALGPVDRTVVLEALRAADLRLVHLSSPPLLARAFSEAEAGSTGERNSV